MDEITINSGFKNPSWNEFGLNLEIALERAIKGDNINNYFILSIKETNEKFLRFLKYINEGGINKRVLEKSYLDNKINYSSISHKIMNFIITKGIRNNAEEYFKLIENCRKISENILKEPKQRINFNDLEESVGVYRGLIEYFQRE